MSTDGVSVIDDSKSLILNEDGTIDERMMTKDKYYFAYATTTEAVLRVSSPHIRNQFKFCFGVLIWMMWSM